MINRRVVVTGVGVISALGRDATEFQQALQQGVSAIKPLEGLDLTRLRMKQAAQVSGYDPLFYFDDKQLNLLDRFAQFGVVAAREAIKDANLDLTQASRETTGIVTGSCVGGQTAEDEVFEKVYSSQSKNLHPLTVPRVMANAAASSISVEFGIKGPTYTVSTACSSSNHAIGLAFQMVRHGMVEMAIAGGSEAPFSLGHLKAWDAIRVVAPDTCRPFSKNRRGMILGEGGAMLVLEPLEAALARGASIYGEVTGFGMSADAHHITQPSAEGAERAISAALRDANLKPEQVEYINAHGTGTLVNDPTEVSAIRSVFGTHAEKLAISSTKSMHGHTLGAAGALEAVATLLALKHNFLPPTANFTEADPQCDLDVIPNQARHIQVEYALSNSLAFGGLNAVLAFHRWNN